MHLEQCHWPPGSPMILAVAITTGAMVRMFPLIQMTPTSPIIPVAWENTTSGSEQSDQSDQIQDKIHMPDSPTD